MKQTLDEIGLTFSVEEMVWIEQRLTEGRYLDVGDYLRDLLRRDQDGLLPDRREMRE